MLNEDLNQGHTLTGRQQRKADSAVPVRFQPHPAQHINGCDRQDIKKLKSLASTISDGSSDATGESIDIDPNRAIIDPTELDLQFPL